MCRQIPPCGENILIGDGDAELGLVVLKARNWSFFFWKLDRKIQFVGWRGVFVPGAEKGIFREKTCFTFPRFKWYACGHYWRGDGPLNDTYFQTASQVRRKVDAVKTQFVYYLLSTLGKSANSKETSYDMVLLYHTVYLFNIYIYIIYMIDFIPIQPFIDANFFRPRISFETFQVCDPQDFPLWPLVGIDNPFLLVSWLPIRWIFPWKIFLLELVRGEKQKNGASNWWKTWYIWYRCDFVLLCICFL